MSVVKPPCRLLSTSQASSSSSIMSARKRMPSYRIWGTTEDGDIEFESLTTETLEGALKVIRESFFRYEPVSIGVDLLNEPGASEELEELCRIAAQDGVSVVAIEVATGQVVSVAFNMIQKLQPVGVKAPFETFAENCKHDSSRALVQFMQNVDTRLDVFGHHNVETILEIMFLATLPSHGKLRLGELVTAASVEIGRQLKAGSDVKIPVEIAGVECISNRNAVPELCSALCTSAYSYKLFTKLGFDTLITVPYNEFEFKGKTFSQRIGKVHESCKLVTKRLAPISLTPRS